MRKKRKRKKDRCRDYPLEKGGEEVRFPARGKEGLV